MSKHSTKYSTNLSNSNNNQSRRQFLSGLGAAALAGMAGCTSGNSSQATNNNQVRAAWVHISEVGDLGWTFAHNNGREAVDEEFDWIETDFSEAVSPSDAERVMEEYAGNGYDVVYGTTFSFMDQMVSAAESNPNTIFEHCDGFETRDNLGRYFGRMYQARFLAGVAAGIVTENDRLGFVGAFPVPQILRGLNAFALGAQYVNEDATVLPQWLNAWYDPPKEQQASQALIEEDVDVMAQHADSPAVMKRAADAGIWASGFNAPMKEFAGENYLVSPIWNWDVFYRESLKAVRDDSWEPDFNWPGLEAGMIGLDEFGNSVPDEAISAVEDAREMIISGDLNVWDSSKFAGESDESLHQEMDSFVEGVEGEVPE